MDLKEFVKGSIVSIVDAIAEAQLEVARKGGHLNPADVSLSAGASATMVVDAEKQAHATIDYLDFDVAVTTGSTQDAQGGVGIKVIGLDFGGKVEGGTSQERISRIRFKVAIVYPYHLDNQLQLAREAATKEHSRRMATLLERAPA